MIKDSSENVTIEFEDSLLNAVYDKFGEDISVVRTGEKKCVAAVSVQISPTFMGWIFQFGKQMRIVSPIWLEEEYKNKLRETLGNIE